MHNDVCLKMIFIYVGQRDVIRTATYHIHAIDCFSPYLTWQVVSFVSEQYAKDGLVVSFSKGT